MKNKKIKNRIQNAEITKYLGVKVNQVWSIIQIIADQNSNSLFNKVIARMREERRRQNVDRLSERSEGYILHRLEEKYFLERPKRVRQSRKVYFMYNIDNTLSITIVNKLGKVFGEVSSSILTEDNFKPCHWQVLRMAYKIAEKNNLKVIEI